MSKGFHVFGHALTVSLVILAKVFADPIDSYWQQKVDYDMDIVLHDSIRQITGKTTIKYTNNSPDSLDKLYMHLYPNAFQVGSVKYREYIGNSGRESRASYFKSRLKGFTSKIDIHEFAVAMPKDGSSWIHKTPILKMFEIDDTILKAKLFKKIAPGSTVRIDIKWTHHVGDMVERAGYFEGQYNMAQWYPKLVVYDENGWHPDVFHAEGEFYGEFGDFKVNFDIPFDFIIAASGVVVKGDPGWESVSVDTSIDYNIWLDLYNSSYIKTKETKRREVSFLAENVHDFAWVASRDFFYEGGISKDNETRVHVLYDKNRGEDWTKVVLERSIHALSWLENKFGDYPYPQITTTDRVKNGGMEYPMLVMNGRDSESLIVHEYGHIYFYGILANNEVEEAWIDEGFTTNQTRDYMMNRYGDHGFDLDLYEGYESFPKKYWPLKNDLHSDQWSAINYMISGYDENISRPSHLYKNAIAYSRNAYGKPSLMLNELRYLLGDSLFYGSIQHLYKKWKLKHIDEDKITEALEEYAGEELDWFFDPWLHTTRHLDYEISSFKKAKNNNSWDIELVIKNKGLRFMPLLIETEYEDGSADRQWWDRHLWRFEDTLKYSSSRKPKVIRLDPDVQLMDLDYRNNTTKIDKRFIFDWPGLNYKPRNAVVYSWMPVFYFYHELSDFYPGLKINKSYGLYEDTNFYLYPSTESKKVYWHINGWRKSVHHFPRTKFYFWGFLKPGVREYGSEIEKKWNRVFGRTYTHTFSVGLYVQPEYHAFRANALGYNPNGRLAVSYFNWSSGIGPFDVNLNASTTLGGYSTWNFNRLTALSTFRSKKIYGLRVLQRITAGKIWSNDNLPGQEGYNINGNSSNEMLKKNYLVDQFYGNLELFNHYHLPGEGNIRGFFDLSARGADALISSSTEFVADRGFLENKFNLSLAVFGDAGVFWIKSPQHPRYPIKLRERIISNLGVGTRIKTKVFEKELFLRVDIPFLSYDNRGSETNFQNWIFSFQRSI